jgi:hypothetical protein
VERASPDSFLTAGILRIVRFIFAPLYVLMKKFRQSVAVRFGRFNKRQGPTTGKEYVLEIRQEKKFRFAAWKKTGRLFLGTNSS